MVSGIKCILSQFADSNKLCDVVNMLEGRDAIQRELIENSPEEKDLGVLVDEKLSIDSAMCTHSPESQPCPGLHQKKCDQQVEGGDSPPLLS
ncbi:cAMP-dependent protein kinase inhibitor alpha [Grus japonensis]|uniref:cAMP-dependent protein kinase inhibitor alpha n=1 Tax=Grus japonensis TaxID=30415 RepID=A0ABC9W9N7_GRUJA